jgi:GNAT superfamily N-acetyltransferase
MREASFNYQIRPATLDDRVAIERLIADSARGLSRADYSDEQIEAAIVQVFGVDTTLILDGTYLVTESDGRLIACGGWSRRKTLFGGDQYRRRDEGELNPATDSAKIRAFFVHPDFARMGVGRALLAACESAAAAHGFQSFELMSTLPGVKLYAACGYESKEPFELELRNGVKLGLVPMTKQLRGR